jgi:hypothetical protein
MRGEQQLCGTNPAQQGEQRRGDIHFCLWSVVDASETGSALEGCCYLQEQWVTGSGRGTRKRVGSRDTVEGSVRIQPQFAWTKLARWTGPCPQDSDGFQVVAKPETL